MTIDLDALEKLARTVSDARKAYSVSEDGSVAESQAFIALDEAGKHLDAAGDPSDLMLALIAELKEARGMLQGFVDDEDDAVTNPIGGLSLGGLMDARDNLGCVYQSAALAGHISQARAFLARNGKGEG